MPGPPRILRGGLLVTLLIIDCAPTKRNDLQPDFRERASVVSHPFAKDTKDEAPGTRPCQLTKVALTLFEVEKYGIQIKAPTIGRTSPAIMAGGGAEETTAAAAVRSTTLRKT